MRVLHLLQSYRPWRSGGTKIFCSRLFQQLKNSIVDVTIALHQAGSLPQPGYYECKGILVIILSSISGERDRARSFIRTTINSVGFAEFLDTCKPLIEKYGYIMN
jgi:hypothetical protein